MAGLSHHRWLVLMQAMSQLFTRVAVVLMSLLLLTSHSEAGAEHLDDDLDLEPGTPVSVLLQQAKTVTLRLQTRDSQAEIIFFDAAAQDVTFRLITHNGAEISSGKLSTYGWAAIPFAVDKRSQTDLQMTATETGDGLPGIRVRVERLSIPRTSLPANQLATKAFMSAQALHRSLRAEDVRQAIMHFQYAADEWKRCGNVYGETLALGAKGESLTELSRYPEARSTLEQALPVAPDVYTRGWVDHLAARVYLDQWEPRPAKRFALDTLQLGQQINDAALIALGHTDLAGVAFWNFDTDAKELADEAHVEAAAAGMPETMGLDTIWKAWLEEREERDARAASLMGEAGFYFRRAGDPRSGLEAASEVAQAIKLGGDLYSALTKLLELKPLTMKTGNLVDYGMLAENIGEIHADLGRPRFASAYYGNAKKAYARAHFTRGLMYVYGDLCEADVRLKQMSEAVADCRVSLTLARETQEPVFIGSALYGSGVANREAGKLTPAFAAFTESARNSHKRRDWYWEGQARLQLGDLLELAGKPSDALVEYLSAEALTKNLSAPGSLIEAQYSTARWYARHNQSEKAYAELRPALEKLETVRQGVSDTTLQASYFATQRKCYELAIEMRMAEFERDPNGGSDAAAMEISEQSRARGLLDAQTATRVPPKPANAQAALIRSNLTLDRAFDRRLRLLVSGGAKQDLQSSAWELARALGDVEQAQDAAQMAASESNKPVLTLSMAALQKASLPSDTTFFEYSLGEKHSYLWVLRAGKRKSVVLPPREQLESMVKRWTDLLADAARSERAESAALKQLSAKVSCAILANSLESDMTRIVIVPDGAVATLPFAALPENGCSTRPGRPILVRHEITITPSLSIYFLQRPQAERVSFQGQVAIIADPVFDASDPRAAMVKPAIKSGSQSLSGNSGIALPRLLNSGFEADAIRTAVLKTAGEHQVLLARGFDASLDAVLSPAMQTYRVWHFATHGVYDENMPEFSGLVFSLIGRDGRPRLGFLKAYDIARLHVPAELVVLSACNTAAGEYLAGEGVMGLSYSFLHAGAQQVVATLWSVDDAKSRELMVSFYEHLLKNGGDAAAALRQSQLAIMRRQESAAPYYWAGFELTSLGK